MAASKDDEIIQNDATERHLNHKNIVWFGTDPRAMQRFFVFFIDRDWRLNSICLQTCLMITQRA